MEVFVGDVTTHHLHNLQPGTTYDLKVFAQYDAGLSGALQGKGTTCMPYWFISHCSFVEDEYDCCLIVQLGYISMMTSLLLQPVP